MRHGIRLDSEDPNWYRTAARRYDTPITGAGKEDAFTVAKSRCVGKVGAERDGATYVTMWLVVRCRISPRWSCRLSCAACKRVRKCAVRSPFLGWWLATVSVKSFALVPTCDSRRQFPRGTMWRNLEWRWFKRTPCRCLSSQKLCSNPWTGKPCMCAQTHFSNWILSSSFL